MSELHETTKHDDAATDAAEPVRYITEHELATLAEARRCLRAIVGRCQSAEVERMIKPGTDGPPASYLARVIVVSSVAEGAIFTALNMGYVYLGDDRINPHAGGAGDNAA